jgi:hypothetical protein
MVVIAVIIVITHWRRHSELLGRKVDHALNHVDR